MTGGGFLAGAIVGKLLLDKTGWNQSISSVGKDETKLKNSAKQIGDSFQAAGKVMAIAGTAVVGSLSAMIVKAAKYGDEMVEVSQKVGINVTTLSSYKLAADKTGTSIDGMARGLKFLSANIIEASNGTGDGARIFKALGVSVVDATGKLRNTDDVLADVAQAFSGLEGGAVKTTTAVKLFGRSGMEMIPFLNLGADGIKKEREEAERLGLVLSGEAAEAQHEFAHQLTALKDGVQGVAITIGTILIPVVKSVVDWMVNLAAGITAAAKTHPELIKVLGSAGLALGSVGMAIGSVILLLPRFMAGLQALKAILSTTALGVGAFTAALTVGVGVIVYYLSKLSELSTAEDELNKANQILRETENQLVDKLSAAAVAADWQYGRMSALIEAYHGNIAALTMAIKTGKEGIDIQNALAEVGKKHAAAIEEQKKKMGEMDPIARALNDALATQKKTTTELTETFTPCTQGMIMLTNGAISAREVMRGFAGTLTNTVIPAARDMSLAMAAAPGTFNEVGSAAEGLEYVFKAIGDAMGVSATTIAIALYNIRADLLATIGIMIPKIESLAPATEKTTKTMAGYFDGLFNDIAIGLGHAIEGFLTGWSDAEKAAIQGIRDSLWALDNEFKIAQAALDKQYKDGLISEKDYLAKSKILLDDYNNAHKKLADDMGKHITGFAKLFKEVWGSIKAAFFRIIGEMIAEWVINFVKNLILGAITAATGVGTSLATIVTSVTSIATLIATIIGTLVAAIAGAVVTMATAIATALVTLATGIASAATIIAAAAPAIIVTSLLALGIKAGLELLKRIFAQGGSGAGDGMGRVVARQDVQISLLTMIKDLTINNRAILDDIKKTLWSISERFSTALGYLKDIAGATNSLSDSIDDLGHDFIVLGNTINKGLIYLGNNIVKGLIFAGEGGEIGTGLRSTSFAERAPEIAMPLREYRTAAASAGAGGSNSNVNVTFNIRALDGIDMINVVRSKVVPILQNILNHNGLRVPTGAVGGA